MARCSADLRALGEGARDMEEVAGKVVRYLHERLTDGAGGRACLLVRFFKTHPYRDLPGELQQVVRASLGGPPEDPELRCLTLLATAGSCPEWNDRRRSRDHQVIPLTSPDAVEKLPMISQLFSQLGFEVGAVLRPDPQFVIETEQRTYNVFYVEEAAGSPYVPAQTEFVERFGVRSVLGFGGMLPAGDLFAVIMFTRAPVPRETAALFRPLVLSAKVALLPTPGVFAP